ncbi:MAG: glutamine--fructose-6-phosphate transaminase (isomerizing) [Candidatus Marinimicrobia bacterium]|nr:glutamine--fructose-6-phosphate transaminase (isomerizing) [Candidatus Neomarinimicrobiota bacterium]
MCGIIGYVGDRDITPVLLSGLKRMEYRGYDSSGVAILGPTGITLRKSIGKISQLEEDINSHKIPGWLGIGHTRWATHGVPSTLNAHPHKDNNGELALIHNGIIENYLSLKNDLVKKGHKFITETDTEVLLHLIQDFYNGSGLESAVRKALVMVRGTYGIALISRAEPDRIVVARAGSPIILGKGKNENFIASDMSAFIEYTNDVIYMNDGEMATITKEKIYHCTLDNKPIKSKVEKITLSVDQIEKSGYPHFMLKEIHEQSHTVEDAMRGRLLEEEGTAILAGLGEHKKTLAQANRIIILACGTSYHAGLIGEYMIEEFGKIPVEVEYASEFRYRNPIIQDGTVVLAISQSGETADTLAAMREAKRKGAVCVSLCNVIGSTIAREADVCIYLYAGPEIGVASTKAFTSQITVLALIALFIGRMRQFSVLKGQEWVAEMKTLQSKIEKTLALEPYIKEIAAKFKDERNVLYLGRGYNFPVALEGALKLKEISYIHAEGYPAAEMKHGPIALIDKDMPVVFIATKDGTYEKIMSNIEEVLARNGRVIAIATEGDIEIQKKAEIVIYVPETVHFLMPILTVIPLQLLAYHIAVLRGADIDQPRNLAKSVTVE